MIRGSKNVDNNNNDNIKDKDGRSDNGDERKIRNARRREENDLHLHLVKVGPGSLILAFTQSPESSQNLSCFGLGKEK